MGGYCWECTDTIYREAEADEETAAVWANLNDFRDIVLDEFYEVCEGCGAHAFVRGGIRTHAFNGVTLRCPECLGIEEGVA